MQFHWGGRQLPLSGQTAQIPALTFVLLEIQGRQSWAVGLNWNQQEPGLGIE